MNENHQKEDNEKGSLSRWESKNTKRFLELRDKAARVLDNLEKYNPDTQTGKPHEADPVNTEYGEAGSGEEQNLSDVKKLVEELRIYQVELEIQNEELRETHNRLDASRKYLADIFYHSPVGYLVLDNEGIIQEANRAASDIFSISPELLTGLRFQSFILPESFPVFSRCFNSLISQEKAERKHVECTDPKSCEPQEDTASFFTKSHTRPGISQKAEIRCQVKEGKKIWVRTDLFRIHTEDTSIQEEMDHPPDPAQDTGPREQDQFPAKKNHEHIICSVLDITGEKAAEILLLQTKNLLESEVEERTRDLEKEIEVRKRTEGDLRNSEALYRLLFEYAGDVILVHGLDGSILDANAVAGSRYGYSKEELPCLHLKDLDSEEDTKKIPERMEKIIRDGKVFFHARHRTKHGSIVDVEVNAVLIRYQEKDAVLSIVRDITKRKEAEKRIRRQGEINSALARLAQKILSSATMSGISSLVLEYAKEFTKSSYGYAGHIDQETGYLIATTMTQGVWDACNVKDKKFVFHPSDGLWGWVLKNREPLLTNSPENDSRSNGVPPGHIPIHRFLSVPALIGAPFEKLVGQIALINSERPYTEDDLKLLERLAALYALAIQQRRTQEELVEARIHAEQANQARGEFLANMSHEIRTPISGIVGITEMTLTQKLDPFHEENLRMIQDAAKSLLGIVNDILDFSKIEAGKLELKPVNFNLAELVEMVMKPLHLTAQEKGIALSCEIQTGLPEHFHGDCDRLAQILRNLVTNAIKFTENGKVHVGVEERKEKNGKKELLFSVRDTGIGISKEQIPVLFSSFNQIDSSYSKKYGGTGLGLAISRQLCGMMSGNIWVDSTPGEGSTFSFTVWMEPAEKIFHLKSREKNTHIPPKNLNILLAEDNILNSRFISHFLEKEGHMVKVAKNGIEAVDAYQKEDFDIILMDIQMPEMDGVAAARMIREIEEKKIYNKKPLYIIALTAYAMKGDRENFLALGMDNYVSKPVDLNALQDAIRASSSCRIPENENLPENGAGMDENKNIQLINMEDIMHRLGGDKALFLEMAALFREQIPYLIEDIENTLKTKDMEDIAKLAHTIKGTTGNMGAQSSYALCLRLEETAKKEQREQAEETARQLIAELRRVETYIGEACENISPQAD